MYKNKCPSLNEVIWLTTMKMRLKMKNRSHRYEINIPRPRMDTNILNIKCVSMIVLCIKQHLSNIWSSIHENIKQHWGWVEKRFVYKKSVYIWELFKFFWYNIPKCLVLGKTNFLFHEKHLSDLEQKIA